jgi:ribosomal protein L18E
MSQIQLNDQQKAIKQKILDIYEKTSTEKTRNNIVLLEGYAGTGKTTLVNQLIVDLKQKISPDNIAIAAFTNKATKVIEKMVHGLGINCTTIHRLFGLTPEVDNINLQSMVTSKQNKGYTLTYKYKEGRESYLRDLKFLIVDEFSVVDKKLAETILSIFRYNPNLIILFMGDRRQLKPIGHTLGDELPLLKMIEPTASEDYYIKYNVIVLDKLTQIMRCKKNILTYYYQFFIDKFETPGAIKADKPMLNMYPYSEDSELIKSQDVYRIITADNYYDYVTLTYSNKAKDERNMMMKYHLSSIGVQQSGARYVDSNEFVNGFNFCIGDIVTLDNHVHLTTYGLAGDQSNMLTINYGASYAVLYNGEFYVIKDIQKLFIMLPEQLAALIGEVEIEGYFVKLKVHDTVDNRDEAEITIPCISFDTKNKLIKAIEDRKLHYRDEKKYKIIISQYFANLYHGYAINLYKSQGSTYANVIIDIADISRCVGYNRVSTYYKNVEFFSCLYVALTRAAKSIYYITS